jgi:DNA polymerase-1
VLGERTAGGAPEKLEDAARRVRDALGDPAASLDSQPKLLRSLHRAGVLAESTSRWELAEYRHPVIEPLLEYKKLSRLLSANGWSWLAEWVHDGRFRPVYVPGGVVTGRWASSGGGALQIPRQLRPAVRADPGWRLVVADVAQLEPRVLAAMARDTALADAARGKDLYAGIVETGAVALRSEAKIAMLGAMYGATTGDSGRLVPRLRRAFPRAMALVDEAARTGENGGVVSTWLGRSSPAPSPTWHDAQSRASDVAASGLDETRARRWARDRGRFTRNFIVQGTAAEWALAWLADLRGRLAAMPPVAVADAAPRSGPVFATRPHLAFFLHDEVMIHAPAAHADAVAVAVREAAASAARLLFGDFPIDFPLELRISESAQKD